VGAAPVKDPMTPTLGVARAGAAVEASVVICSYTMRRWTDLGRAVESALAQRGPVREVVVIVDHNPELLVRAACHWGGGTAVPVKVMANVGARGLSGARNSGVAVASAEIVAFLDDDAEADLDWIERLLAVYADPHVVACGGTAVPRITGTRPTWWPAEFDWVIGCSYVGLPVSRSAVRNLIGANMSMRRADIVEAGGFAEGLGRVGTRPTGCEETELCIRLVQRDPTAVVVFEPAARVHHTVPVERLSWRYFRARCFAEGISKAMVAARVGRRCSLASERAYVASVLPRAVLRGLRRGAGRRALAVVAGLLITVAGYATGRINDRFQGG